MHKARNYKNFFVPVRYEDQIESALNARGEECESLTEAKRKARELGGYAIRAYYAKDSGALIGYKIFA